MGALEFSTRSQVVSTSCGKGLYTTSEHVGITKIEIRPVSVVFSKSFEAVAMGGPGPNDLRIEADRSLIRKGNRVIILLGKSSRTYFLGLALLFVHIPWPHSSPPPLRSDSGGV
jgi:hypothetical protein